MRRATADQLADLLTPSGELVPVVLEATGERLVAVKVRRVVDCLDEQASVLGPLALTLAFDADRVPTGGLFKVPQLQETETFVAEASGKHSLRSRVADLGLSGITFERVWAHPKPSESSSCADATERFTRLGECAAMFPEAPIRGGPGTDCECLR
jgi:hypothetical protein